MLSTLYSSTVDYQCARSVIVTKQLIDSVHDQFILILFVLADTIMNVVCTVRYVNYIVIACLLIFYPYFSDAQVERNRHGITVVHFPHDPDDLPAIPRPPAKNVPEVCRLGPFSFFNSHFLLSTTAGHTRKMRIPGSLKLTHHHCTRTMRVSTMKL